MWTGVGEINQRDMKLRVYVDWDREINITGLHETED